MHQCHGSVKVNLGLVVVGSFSAKRLFTRPGADTQSGITERNVVSHLTTWTSKAYKIGQQKSQKIRLHIIREK